MKCFKLFHLLVNDLVAQVKYTHYTGTKVRQVQGPFALKYWKGSQKFYKTKGLFFCFLCVCVCVCVLFFFPISRAQMTLENCVLF